MQPVLFFDWDGTLADSMPICIAECHLALRAVGLPDLPDEVVMKCNGPTYQEGCDVLNIPPALRETFMAQRMAIGLSLVPTTQRLFPGIREMLDALHGKAQLVIVSNGQDAYLQKSVDAMDVRKYFTHIQANRPGCTKAQLMDGLLQEIRPKRAVMIGDRLSDIQSGRANGLPTIAACYGYGNEAEYAQADFRVGSPEELTRQLLEMFC